MASEKIELNLQANNENGKLDKFIKFHSGSKVTFITPTLQPYYNASTNTFNDDNIDVEVGAEVEHILGTTGTNTGEVFDYICPSSDKRAFSENDSTAENNGKEKKLSAPNEKENSFAVLPNPSAEYTLFEYSLKENSTLTLTIHNVFGQQIARLIDQQVQQAGTHTFTYDASKLPAGIYICTFEAKSEKGEVFKEVKKLVKLK